MDFYNDDSDSQEQTATAESPQEDQGEQEIALIPKSALQGKDCKVGDRLNFEVTAVDEDSVECKLVGAEHENPEEQRSEMDSMMSDEGEGEGY